MKIAVIQLRSTEKKSKNVDLAKSLVSQAISAGAKLIVLPEVFVFRGKLSNTELVKNIAESTSGETIKGFQVIAKENRVGIVAGSIYEKLPGKPKVYNTTVVIDENGRRHSYRKIKLFDATLKGKRIAESDRFYAGKKQLTVNVHGFKIGIAICYDLRFGELFKNYAKKKADIVCVPSAFTYQTGKAHWDVLLRSRAIETQAYIAAPNQIGTDSKGLRCYGHSMIIDPWGKIIANAKSKSPKIIYSEIDKKVIRNTRKSLPNLNK